jgi:hypothetical protein
MRSKQERDSLFLAKSIIQYGSRLVFIVTKGAYTTISSSSLSALKVCIAAGFKTVVKIEWEIKKYGLDQPMSAPVPLHPRPRVATRCTRPYTIVKIRVRPATRGLQGEAGAATPSSTTT